MTDHEIKDARPWQIRIDEIVLSLGLHPYSLALYVALCSYADVKQSTAFPSKKELAKKAGMSTRAVKVHLDKLVEANLISIAPRERKNGSQTSNLYIILDPNARGGAPDARGGVHQMHPHNYPHIEQESLSEIVAGVNPATSTPEQSSLANDTKPNASPPTNTRLNGRGVDWTDGVDDTSPPPSLSAKNKPPKQAPQRLPEPVLALAEGMAQALYGCAFADVQNGRRWALTKRAHDLHTEGVAVADIQQTQAFILAQDWPRIYNVDTFCKHIESARAWQRDEAKRRAANAQEFVT